MNETNYKKILRGYGFKQKSSQLVGFIIILFIAGVLSLLTWALIEIFEIEKVSWTQNITLLLSAIAVMIAYWQWRAARIEISIDKYYDRLDVANKRLETLDNSQESKANMHVFAELDKLEYVIVKYEMRYMTAELTYRGLENFKQHCADRPDFNQKALHWVKKASYLQKTRKVVEKVCAETCENA